MPFLAKDERGFSLIETLVVVGVLAILGYVLTGLIGNVLKGGNKTELIGAVKQNGERALGVMSDAIKSADDVVCAEYATAPQGLNYGDTLVLVTGGNYTRFRFFAPTSSANGYLQEDFPPAPADPNQSVNLCTNTTYSGTVALTDTDPLTGVSVQSGALFQYSPGLKGIVKIRFSLLPGVQAGVGAQNEIGGPISFTTSAGPR